MPIKPKKKVLFARNAAKSVPRITPGKDLVSQNNMIQKLFKKQFEASNLNSKIENDYLMFEVSPRRKSNKIFEKNKQSIVAT